MDNLTEKSSYEDFNEIPIVTTKGGLKEVLDYLASDEYAEKLLQYADKGYNKKRTMDFLTEKSPYEDLYKAWQEVNDYGERAANAKAVKQALKKSDIACRRVNTPAKNRALYVFVKGKTQMYHMPFLIVEGNEGDSFVALEDKGKRNDNELAILHSHAINRYIERHGWDGTLEECQNHLLCEMWVTSQHVDRYTQELIVYFDDGLFLGCIKDGISHLNTYVANQHLFPYQRLKSRTLQEAIEKLFNEI